MKSLDHKGVGRTLFIGVCIGCRRDFMGRREARYCCRGCATRARPSTIQEAAMWWKNGRGYIVGRVITAQGVRNVKQHRFVMECALGRLLRADEHVHHLNNDKTDNRLGNLQILSHSEHSSLTGFERVHPKGYKLRLSEGERQRRSDAMRERHLTLRLERALSPTPAEHGESGL